MYKTCTNFTPISVLIIRMECNIETHTLHVYRHEDSSTTDTTSVYGPTYYIISHMQKERNIEVTVTG